MRGCVIVLFGALTCILGWYAHAEYQKYQQYRTQIQELHDKLLIIDAEHLEQRLRLNRLEDHCRCQEKP